MIDESIRELLCTAMKEGKKHVHSCSFYEGHRGKHECILCGERWS